MGRVLTLLAVFAEYLSVLLSTVPLKKRKAGGGGRMIVKLRIHFSIFLFPLFTHEHLFIIAVEFL